MPFSPKSLPASAKNLTGQAVSRFVAAANKALDRDPDDEGGAIRIGLAAAKSSKGDGAQGSIRRMAIGDSLRVYREDRIGVVYVVDERGRLPAGAGPGALKATLDPTTGFLHVQDSRMARSGPLEYSDGQTVWTEFRSDAAVRAGAPSFANIVFTNRHPPVLVTTENIQDFQAGHVGNTRTDGVFMVADELVITRRDAIDRAQQPGGWELSIGFLADVLRRDGVAPDGTPFKFEQLNLEGNHLAGVDQGRAGPECRLGMDSAFSVAALADSATTPSPPLTHHGGTMPTEEEKKAAEAKAKLKADAAAKIKADAEKAEQLKADEAKRKADEANKPADAPAKFDHAAAVRGRIAIVDSVKTVLGTVDHEADDSTLMLAVIAKVDGEDAMKAVAAKSDDYVRATFDAAVRTHAKQSRTDTAMQIAGVVSRGHMDTAPADKKIDLAAEFDKLNTYYRDAHKQPAAHMAPVK